MTSLITQISSAFDIAPGSMSRRVLALAWPSVLEQSLLTLVGLVDVYIVGHLGAEAIAGVGLGNTILNLTAALFGALGVGATAVVAREIGAKRGREASIAAGQGILVAAAIGAIASTAAFFFASSLITLYGGEPGVQIAGTAWLRASGPSFLFMGLMLVGSAAMRGAGDTRTPLVIMLISNAVNIVTAWTLTRGLGWNVTGNGLGVTLGHVVGGVLVLIVLFFRSNVVRIKLSDLEPDRAYIERIFNVGLPAGGEQLLLQSALAYSAVLITGFGTAAYAAHQIGLRVSALSYLPGWGFSIAATTLVGQELGAKNPDGARAASTHSLIYATLVMSGLGLLLLIFDEAIVRIFTTDASVIHEGVKAIRIAALIQPIMAYSFVHGGSLRGAGDTRSTMLITASSVWGLRIVVIYLLGTLLGLGITGAWLAVGADFAVRGVLFGIRWRGGKWASLRV
ncbi:MAG TPA: MATE family efflux transporter [Anaerolineales bacterium]|nr:MATE family efflux transporter [Anaerolineales bacterium]